MVEKTLNFNVGVLGHVDSGKTSLAKAISTVASTACFDKNPQSKERGITIDLGFSSFILEAPEHIKNAGYTHIQFTLVDCPGHASLIKTIIGGAQIIDLMMLVVDVCKGIQTQTAECLVIGEVTCQKMIVALNKIDLLKPDKKQATIEKMKKRLLLTLEKTCFKSSSITPVSAQPGGTDGNHNPEGIDELMKNLLASAYIPSRSSTQPFVFAVDHCFSLRGQGTVMTGTVLSGSVNTGDTVEVPSLASTKKIKSMQMFHVAVNKASQGDRVGICVTQFDPKLLERGLVCTPGHLPTIHAALIAVNKINYYKHPVKSKAKFHISMGHETVMGKVTFFGTNSVASKDLMDISNLNIDEEYIYLDELNENEIKLQYALLELETPATIIPKCLVIGSKLDSDIHLNQCRIAFKGHLLDWFTDKNYLEKKVKNIKIYKNKSKSGVVDRLSNEYEVIGKSMFKKETNMSLFAGMKVHLSTGESGVIEGGFGQSGKFKIRIPAGLQESTQSQMKEKSKKKNDSGPPNDNNPPITITLDFKKYIFDPQKKMIQTK